MSAHKHISQVSLFPTELKVPEFKHKSRGHIYTERIWKMLDINSKINMRAIYKAFMPNYNILDSAIEQGFDKSPFADNKSGYTGYPVMTYSGRKFKSI